MGAPSRKRAVSVLEVDRPERWDELVAAGVGEDSIESRLGPLRAVVSPVFEAMLPDLRKRGTPVLVRHARRTAAELQRARADLEEALGALPREARALLHRVQPHARGHVVIGAHVWDPEWEAEWVNVLFGAGLMEPVPDGSEPRHGRYRLHPDLPPPPDRDYDFSEAVMPLTDDLPAGSDGPVDLLHDLAALSAALDHHRPRRTHAGSLDKTTARKLGARLGAEALAEGGDFAGDARWSRALRALEALGGVELDPASRELYVEPGLEEVLAGTTADAVDRLLHRLLDHDLQAMVPALRAALAQAGDGAVDEMIFVEELATQHRDVIFAPWLRDGLRVYPGDRGNDWIPWLPEAFEAIEGRMIEDMLRTLARVGLVRRAPGVFAATADGLLWATGTGPAAPPVWVGSDLHLLVPPHAITPWERYQLERLGRCTARDVVDRYVLDRAGVETWLATHDIDDAVDLLRRRCPGVPPSVVETLQAWAESAQRFVLTRGVVVEG